MNTMQAMGIAALLLGGPMGQSAQASGTQAELGVARISLTNGEVTLQRGASGDWIEGSVNTPLVEGDSLAAGSSSRTEVQLDSANFVRLQGDSRIHLAELGHRRFRLQLESGTLTYNELKGGEADVDIETPFVAIRPLAHGLYRVEVGLDGKTVITVRRGKAEIASAAGTEKLDRGETMIVRADADGAPLFQVDAAAPKDDWDRWNERREKLLRRSISRRYVSQDIYGVEDLDYYGSWRYVSGYGYSWFPTVDIGWSPYRLGRWTWLDYYGWCWVGSEPWGWAPYHYGRWYRHNSYGWGWYPGHHHRRHYWRPAHVAFFGYGSHSGFRAGLGLGFGHIGWVPLAPYEPYYPWYGGRYGARGHGRRHGRSGGGRNTTIFVDNSVNIYNNYRNARARNGVTMIDAQNFARGRVRNPRSPRRAELRQAGLMRGQVPVVPQRESRGRAVRAANDRNLRAGSARERGFFSRRLAGNRDARASFEQQRLRMSRSVQAFEASQPSNRRVAGAPRARSGVGAARAARTGSTAASRRSVAGAGRGAGNPRAASVPSGPGARNSALNRGAAARNPRGRGAWRQFGGVRNGRGPATPAGTSTSWRRFGGGTSAPRGASRSARPTVSSGNSSSPFRRGAAPRQNSARTAGPSSRGAAPSSNSGSRGFAPRGNSRTANGGSNRSFSSRSVTPRPNSGNRAAMPSALPTTPSRSTGTFRRSNPAGSNRGNRRSTYQPRSRSRGSTFNIPAGNAGTRRSGAGSRGVVAPPTTSRVPATGRRSGSPSFHGPGGSSARPSAPSVNRSRGSRAGSRSTGSGRGSSFGGPRSPAGRSSSGGGFGASAQRSTAPRSGGSLRGRSQGGAYGGGASINRGGGASRGSSLGSRSSAGARANGGGKSRGNQGGGRFGRR